MSISAGIFSISRLRIETDGRGVRSLVCFRSCSLDCKYCINKDQMKSKTTIYTPQSLYEDLKIDYVYIKASDGGVTFGGGEPALLPFFIEEFRHVCNPEWAIDIETALNVSQDNIAILAKVIDHWFIDVKDFNDETYKAYTGKSNRQVKSNLEYLIKEGLADRITVRVPNIPNFNNEEDVQKTVSAVKEMGIDDVEVFDYVTVAEDRDQQHMGQIIEPDKPRIPMWITGILLFFIVALTCAICYFLIPKTIMAIVGTALVGLIVLLICMFFLL